MVGYQSYDGWPRRSNEPTTARRKSLMTQDILLYEMAHGNIL